MLSGNNFFKKSFSALALFLSIWFLLPSFAVQAQEQTSQGLILAQSGRRVTPSATPVDDSSSGDSDVSGSSNSELCDGSGMVVVNGICVPKTCTGGLCSTTRFADLVQRVVLILLTVSGLIAVVLIIIGGFQMILSRGNEESAKKGKQTLTYAVIGLIVVMMSYAIVAIITGTLTSNTFMGGGGSTGGGNPDRIPRP